MKRPLQWALDFSGSIVRHSDVNKSTESGAVQRSDLGGDASGKTITLSFPAWRVGKEGSHSRQNVRDIWVKLIKEGVGKAIREWAECPPRTSERH